MFRCSVMYTGRIELLLELGSGPDVRVKARLNFRVTVRHS